METHWAERWQFSEHKKWSVINGQTKLSSMINFTHLTVAQGLNVSILLHVTAQDTQSEKRCLQKRWVDTNSEMVKVGGKVVIHWLEDKDESFASTLRKRIFLKSWYKKKSIQCKFVTETITCQFLKATHTRALLNNSISVSWFMVQSPFTQTFIKTNAFRLDLQLWISDFERTPSLSICKSQVCKLGSRWKKTKANVFHEAQCQHVKRETKKPQLTMPWWGRSTNKREAHTLIKHK